MPVNLDLLPKPLTMKKGLSRSFWCITLIVFIVISVILICLNQPNYKIGIEHIIIAVIFAFIGWIILLLIWLLFRGYKEFYVEGWNKLREDRKQELIEFGQKPVYVIFNQLHSEFGDENHAQALISGLLSIEAKTTLSSSDYNNPIIHSRFNFNNLKNNDFSLKIDELFKELQGVISILNNKVFQKKQKHIRIFIDVPISSELIKLSWEKKLGLTAFFDSWSVIDAKESSVFLDSWLDNSKNNDHILCCISLHLYDLPYSYSSEVMTSMICLGKNIFQTDSSIQYIQENKLTVVALHRTQESDNLDDTLEHAELWGDFNIEESDQHPIGAIWLSKLTSDINVRVLSRYIDKVCSIDNVYHINTTFGISGECDYWVGLAFAIENAKYIDEKQIVIGENQNRFNATVIERINFDREFI